MLTVITGPMFSGKTSKLISMCVANIIAGNKVVVFKPANDTRYDATNVVSHNLDKFAAVPINQTKPSDIFKVMEDLGSPDVVFFDEAQFFAPEIVDVVEMLYNTIIKEIVVAGLAQDSSGKGFGEMPTLLSKADNIILLKAVCSKCKGLDKATRTLRKGKSPEQVLIGGTDKYEAACFRCWKAFK